MEAQNKDDFKMFEHTEERPSLFDGFSKTSWISTSVYRGIWRLLIFAITIGLAIDAFSNFLQKGFLFEMELYYKLIDNLEYLAIHCSHSIFTAASVGEGTPTFRVNYIAAPYSKQHICIGNICLI
jgi:hypothetical protein